jgi:hypothetical protein
MISSQCGHLVILAAFTAVGLWMLINNLPHAETVYITFQSGLFLRMQIKPDGKELAPAPEVKEKV